MRWSYILTATVVSMVVGCPDAAIKTNATGSQRAKRTQIAATRSKAASDGRLQILFEIEEGAVADRVPMRTAVLHFKNVSKEPLRVYLPDAEPFRANISTLIFAPKGARPLLVPEPRPHGYVVTEKDFHLIEPGKSISFTQRFTIDPFAPGGGNRSKRLAGFEPKKTVAARWIYENQIRQWKGGVKTSGGPTRELFGGKEIPYIWTGKLTTKGLWTTPE